MKLMITGHKRFGKDHAAEYFKNNFGLKYEGSSKLCSKLFIFNTLKDKYGYTTEEECFEDRHNHRSEWFDLISDFNKNDLTALATLIFEQSDCYTGIRSRSELMAAKMKWPKMLVIYINRPGFPLEESASCTITSDMADIIIENNSDLVNFEDKLFRLGSCLFKN